MLLPQLCDLKYVTSRMGRRRGRRIPRFRNPVGSRGLLGQLAIPFPGPNITRTRALPCGPALAEYNRRVGQLRLEQLHQNLQPQNHLVVSQRGAMISDRISSPSVVFRAARKYARRKANVSFPFHVNEFHDVTKQVIIRDLAMVPSPGHNASGLSGFKSRRQFIYIPCHSPYPFLTETLIG